MKKKFQEFLFVPYGSIDKNSYPDYDIEGMRKIFESMIS